MKNVCSPEARPVFVSFSMALAVGLTGLVSGFGSPAEAQSRPPVSGGASGGANPGNSSGSGYNPGNNSGSGYNPGQNSGGGYNPGDYNRNFIIVYRHSEYRGSSVRFDGEIENLSYSGMNDEISSMRLRGTWLACTDANFRGRCRTFRNSVGNLRDHGMNDQISSLRPLR